MINFDLLLENLGGFGKYQLLVFLSLLYYQVPGGLNTIAPVFISYAPTFRCQMYPFDNATLYPNLTEQYILNLTTELDENGKAINPCVRYGYNLTECEVKDDFSCVDKNASEIACQDYHYDDSLFNETTITQFDLVCDRSTLHSVASSSYMVGILIGSLIFGDISDRFGRKTTGIVAGYGMLVSMLLLAYSNSITLFIIWRFTTAVFTFGTCIGTFCHIMEIVGTNYRTAVGMAFSGAFAIGYMLWSGIAYMYRDWHQMQLGALVLSAPFALIILIVPESPRWLFAQDRVEEGKKVTETMAKLNRPKIELSEYFWEEVEVIVEHKKITSKKTDRKHNTLDLFKHPGLRMLTLKVGFCWLVTAMVYYGVAYNTGYLSGNIFLNNVYGGLVEIVSHIICVPVMDRVGRRFLLSFTLVGTGVFLIAATIVNEAAGYNAGLITLGVVLTLIAKGFISGSLAVVLNFAVECFPTVVRGNGIGFGVVCGRIGAITCPFILQCQSSINWLPYSIFGVSAILASLVAATLRDTTGVDLMETIEDAEEFLAGKADRIIN